MGSNLLQNPRRARADAGSVPQQPSLTFDGRIDECEIDQIQKHGGEGNHIPWATHSILASTDSQKLISQATRPVMPKQITTVSACAVARKFWPNSTSRCNPGPNRGIDVDDEILQEQKSEGLSGFVRRDNQQSTREKRRLRADVVVVAQVASESGKRSGHCQCQTPTRAWPENKSPAANTTMR